MKLFAQLAAGGAVLFCGFCGILGYLVFFIEPPSKEGMFAKGAVESPAILADLGLKGGVLHQKGRELSLTTSEGRRVVYQADNQWRLMKIAGPNKADKIALVTIGPRMDVYKLLLLDLKTGSKTETEPLKGDVIWDEAVGDCALHPTEPKLAHFRGNGRSHQFNSPKAYVVLGKIVEHDFTTGKEKILVEEVMEQAHIYSPDGKFLFCTKKTPRSKLEAQTSWPAPELAQFSDKDQPGIIRVDLQTGAETVMGYGWASSVTRDGRDLVVRGYSKHLGFQSLDKGDWTPGRVGGMLEYVYPFEHLSRDLVLGSALPLTEKDVEFFPWTGSVSGRHQKMRLGVFNLKTKQAAILRTDLDRYEVVAWWPASR